MKFPLYLILLYSLIVVACNSEPKSVGNAASKSDHSSAFLNKFKLISVDTLKIQSLSQENSKNEFLGNPLDTADAKLFPKEMAEKHLKEFPSLFAYYKFPIGKQKLGLIVRTPAMYIPSSVKLFIYDLNSKTLTESVELAENWGDAGDSLIKTSWLFQDQNKIQVFMWVNEGHDNSVNNPTDETITISDKYYLLGIHSKVDTLSQDSIGLETRFKNLLPQRDALIGH